ncbi:hypothetical protein PoB_003741200 [Plakobranchus ocellatus]|uniref:Uncharacterized protein n=1 Tax=Plakobranchus ocellatus TaxID=259542 RepID=A0AAV4AVC8_9GAST|nr:hypothetical protein PoB_003741200 [Plakobranchus ocellatus]
MPNCEGRIYESNNLRNNSGKKQPTALPQIGAAQAKYNSRSVLQPALAPHTSLTHGKRRVCVKYHSYQSLRQLIPDTGTLILRPLDGDPEQLQILSTA